MERIGNHDKSMFLSGRDKSLASVVYSMRVTGDTKNSSKENGCKGDQRNRELEETGAQMRNSSMCVHCQECFSRKVNTETKKRLAGYSYVLKEPRQQRI